MSNIQQKSYRRSVLKKVKLGVVAESIFNPKEALRKFREDFVRIPEPSLLDETPLPINRSCETITSNPLTTLQQNRKIVYVKNEPPKLKGRFEKLQALIAMSHSKFHDNRLLYKRKSENLSRNHDHLSPSSSNPNANAILLPLIKNAAPEIKRQYYRKSSSPVRYTSVRTNNEVQQKYRLVRHKSVIKEKRTAFDNCNKYYSHNYSFVDVKSARRKSTQILLSEIVQKRLSDVSNKIANNIRARSLLKKRVSKEHSRTVQEGDRIESLKRIYKAHRNPETRIKGISRSMQKLNRIKVYPYANL